MGDIKLCSDCGFKAHEVQWQKTKGQCPCCAPEEAEAYLERARN